MKFRLIVAIFLLVANFVSDVQAAECDKDSIVPQRFSQWDVPGDPWGVAIDPQDYVFVTDPVNDRICRYSLEGGSPLYFGTTGDDKGEFIEPHWIAFDPDRGRLYVVDNDSPGDDRVQVFDRNGSHLFTIGDLPPSTAPGSFAGRVHCVALDVNGNIFVADRNLEDDTWYDRIQVFGPDGSFQRVFAQVFIIPGVPTLGQWRHLDDIEITSDGEVFLLDTGVPGYLEKRVHHLGIDGSPIDLWGANGDGPGQFDYPNNLTSDDSEFVWVSNGSRLQKFRRNGDFILEIKGDVVRDFEGIDLHPEIPSILYAGSFGWEADPERIEVLVEPIPAYNILNSHWLDANHQFIGDNPALLIDCDEKNSPIDAVSADGVTPVLMTYEFDEPYNVTWSITDMNPGSVPGGIGELSSIDGAQHGSSVVVLTENIAGRHVAFVIYTAPIDFDRPGCPEDLPLEGRGVRVSMDYVPVGGGQPGSLLRGLEIVRPPIVFVHGLWSSPDTWLDFTEIVNDSRWRANSIDYKSTHGEAFVSNMPKFRDQIYDIKTLDRSRRRTASAQIDLIAHSMGGCLARKLAGSADYLRADNLGQGDFHKLLTLNTPHLGSPLASAIVSIRSDLSVSSALLIKAIAIKTSTSVDQIMSCAMDDLSPGSYELAAFGALDVPARAHVGVGGSDFGPGIFNETGSDPFAAVYVLLAKLTDEPSLEEFAFNEHDIFVLRDSQVGGLNPLHYDVSNFEAGLHLKATSVAETGNIALQWAQTPTSDTSYFGTFPAPQPAQLSSQEPWQMTSEYGGVGMSLDVSPGTGQPGQDITITVFPETGVQLTDVIVYYPGGALVLESPNLSGTVTIPVDRYGSIELGALGKTETGEIIDSYPASINVSQPTQPTSLSTFPTELVFGAPGELRSLTVYAHFPDGIARDLSPVVTSLDYSGYNAIVIEVKEDRGAIQAVREGSTSLTVEFSGLSVDVPVTVFDGEQLNNPPHADAGGDYTFCGGEEFCLEGNGSYDDDIRFGDSLTYRWDLNADGVFDDAIGASPCIVFGDGSQSQVVALEVTDSDGLTSRDLAVLSPVDGFCQTATSLCEVGQNSASYDPFPATSGIDVDGSGGFHVLVIPWIFPSAVRIVSFSDQCGFVDEFELPYRPHNLAVSPDGIIHVIDYQLQVIRRYLVGGNELPSIPLPQTDLGWGSYLEYSPEGYIIVEAEGWDGSGQWDYQVHMIDGTGTIVRSVSARDDLGINSSLNDPVRGFHIGDNGTVYLVTNDNLYRSVYNGQFTLDLTVQLNSFQEACTDIAAGPDGAIYIVNYNGVHKFNPDGTYNSARTRFGGLNFNNLKAIAVDCADRVFLAEQTNRAIVTSFGSGEAMQTTPVIDESMVSVARTFNPTFSTESWTFVWETDIQGDPALDQVIIGDVSYACQSIVEPIISGPPDFANVDQVTNGFRHTLRWDGVPCTPNCSIPYRVESGVSCYKSQSDWRTVKIKNCLMSF